MGFSENYAKFRSGRVFLIALASVISFWLLWNSLPGLPHFDSDWGRLNTLLSIEASVSIGVMVMADQKVRAIQIAQEKAEQERQIQMLAMMETQSATAKILVEHAIEAAQRDHRSEERDTAILAAIIGNVHGSGSAVTTSSTGMANGDRG